MLVSAVLLRPVTYIKQHIDASFSTIIGTPPFPSYISGHSCEAGAASKVYINLFTNGDGAYDFTDESQLQYGFAPRTYTNFNMMAEECANSRFYAGIHYPMDNEKGLQCGGAIGDDINTLIQWPTNVRWMAMKKEWLVLLILLASSCSQTTKKNNDRVKQIADLECRAISMREMRFSLANKIRFTQDTLLHPASSSYSARLNDSLRIFLQQKDFLLQASLQLADTIHHQLDSLRKYAFENKNEKLAFDKELKEELERRGCNR